MDSPLAVLRHEDDRKYGKTLTAGCKSVLIPVISTSDFKTPQKISLGKPPPTKRARLQLFTDEEEKKNVSVQTEKKLTLEKELAVLREENQRFREQLEKPKVSSIVLKSIKTSIFYTGLTKSAKRPSLAATRRGEK